MMDALVMAEGLCKRFEGLYLRPYLCPAGVPTIGYGATFYENGRRVMLTDPPISKARAEQLLRWHLTRRFIPAVMALCPGAETPQQVAALADFAFNLGEGNLRTSTLRRKVNAGQWDEVPAQLMRWNKAGGRVLRGLTRRRQAEIDLLS
jgi:lysozyme